MRLTVELVPQTSWGTNVRSMVDKSSWDRIRRKCYKAADYSCEICGGVGPRHPVECHEIWHYNDDTNVQTLTGFVALCPNCHRVKHLGRTFAVGLGHGALKHLSHVNEMTMNESADYVDNVFEQWKQRSILPWTVDISFIDSYIEEVKYVVAGGKAF